MAKKTLKKISKKTLMRKIDYHRKYGTPRPTIDAMIERGELKTEDVGGLVFIVVKT